MQICQKTELNNKGFTLIELLTVIAIIGILSTLGMISLGSARQKAYDAQIKSDIANARISLAMCFDDNNGSYGNCKIPANFVLPKCSSDYATNYKLNVDTDNYVVWAGMCSQLGSSFCADSSGFVGIVSSAGLSTASTKCN